jgi:CrcB protein
MESSSGRCPAVKVVAPYFIVFLGAGVGGALRHSVNLLTAKLLGLGFPYGTITVNVIGSLLMALIAEYFALRGGPPQHWRLFLTTGVLGGFTTFSAFSLDVVTLYERGQAALATGYALGSVVVSLAAFFMGLAVVRLALRGVA